MHANLDVGHRVEKRLLARTLRHLVQVIARDHLHQAFRTDHAFGEGIEA